MDAFVSKAIEKLWLKPISIFILFGIMVLGGISYIPMKIEGTSTENTGFTLSIQLSIYIIIMIVFLLLYCIYVYKHNKLPKVKKDKIGIMFIVNSENINQFKDIKTKLIDKFDLIMSNDAEKNFCSIYLQEEHISNYDIFDKQSLIKLLKKTSCIFSVRIKIIANDNDNATKYEIIINNGVLHPQYEDKVQNMFSNELNLISTFVKQTRFQKENKIEELEVTATQLAFVCKYIIGITYFLSYQILIAEKILEELHEEVGNIRKNIDIVNYLKDILPFRCFEVHVLRSYIAYKDYRKNKNEIKLKEFGDSLEEANSFLPNTYIYFLNMAIYYICSDRSVYKAKECIAKCSLLKGDNVWRYSDAFLCAYEGTGVLTIYRKYKQAFKIQYNLGEISIFIEEILEQEPNKFHLSFALGMVYSEMGDWILAELHFKKFYNSYNGSIDMTERLNKIIKERLNNKHELSEAV